MQKKNQRLDELLKGLDVDKELKELGGKIGVRLNERDEKEDRAIKREWCKNPKPGVATVIEDFLLLMEHEKLRLLKIAKEAKELSLEQVAQKQKRKFGLSKKRVR